MGCAASKPLAEDALPPCKVAVQEALAALQAEAPKPPSPVLDAAQQTGEAPGQSLPLPLPLHQQDEELPTPFASPPPHEPLLIPDTEEGCIAVSVAMPLPPEVIPIDEEARLRSLRELGLLGRPPSARFDEIASLMRETFGVALAAVSLVESKHIVFYTRAGDQTLSCVPRVKESFCAHVIVPEVPSMLIVEDTWKDARFKDCLIVTGPPHVRFYCGAPLVSSDSGYKYGALFLMDYRPRTFTPELYALLANFAEVITREMERDKVMRWREQVLESAAEERTAMLRAADCFTEGVVLIDTSRPQWPLLFSNAPFEEAAGISHSEALGCGGFWSLFECQNVEVAAAGEGGQLPRAAAARGAAGGGMPLTEGAAPHSGLSEGVVEASTGEEGRAWDAAEDRRPFRARVVPRGGEGASTSASAYTLDFEFKPVASGEHLRRDCPHVAVPSYVSSFGGQEPGSSYYFAVLQHLPPGRAAVGSGEGAALASFTSTTTDLSGPSTPTRASTPLGVWTSGDGSQIDAAGSECAAVQRPATPSAVSEPGASVPARATSCPPLEVTSFHLLRPKEMESVLIGPLIGVGSHGRCYRGYWHGGHVAVKILDCWVEPSELGASKGPRGELLSSAMQEALLSRSLAHPHIVTTYDYGCASEVEAGEGWGSGRVRQQVWLMQSYSNRGTLGEGLERGLLRGPDGGPNTEAILQTAIEIASAMCFVHNRGVVHADLTLNNVLLTASHKDARRWMAQVADFGLSKLASWKDLDTTSLGTVTHMPPEVLTEGSVSLPMDVFSFGVLLWEMWMGKRAWGGLTAAQIAHAVGSGSKTLPIPEDAPSALQDLMRHCMERDPAKRPPFAAVLTILDRELEMCSELDFIPFV